MINEQQVEKRKYQISLVIGFVFLLQLLFTKNAWLPYDFDFPVTTLIPGFDLLDAGVNKIVFYLLLSSLVFLVVKKYQKIILAFVLFFTMLLVMDNVNRFQPWLFMHIITLSVVVYCRKYAMNMLRLFLVALYLWSGFNKFNLNFAWEVFPYFMKAFGLNELFYLPPDEIGKYAMPIINHLAWIVPVTEVLIGAGLIIPRLTKTALWLGVLLHLTVLFILGPFGLNWNEVVWSWNVEFIVLLFLLFGNRILVYEPIQIRPTYRYLTGKLYFLLVMIMPAAWYFGVWPNNFSYHLYSGTNPNIRFYFEGINTKILESDLKEFTFYDVDRQQSYIMVDYYLMDKIRVPVFAEPFYFRQTAAKLCSCYGYTGSDAGLRIMDHEKFTGRLIVTDIPCSELKSGQ